MKIVSLKTVFLKTVFLEMFCGNICDIDYEQITGDRLWKKQQSF